MNNQLRIISLIGLLSLFQSAVVASDSFTLSKSKGTWTLVSPSGQPYWSLGVNHIGNTDATANDEAEDVRFARANAVELLQEMGFNCAGGDCRGEILEQLPYFVTIGLTNTAHWMPGHQFQFEDVFEDSYAKRIEAATKRTCEQHRDNPNLIGYYWTDTPRWDLELTRVRRNHDWVSYIRSLPSNAAGNKAYVDFLRKQYSNSIENLNKAFRTQLSSFDDIATTDLNNIELLRPGVRESDEAFLGVIARRIYSVAKNALDRHDPQALVFGEKYKGHDHPDSVLTAAAEFVDVISIQPGPEFGPFPGQGRHEQIFDGTYFSDLHQKTGKPIMIADHAISWDSPNRPTTLWYQYPTQEEAVRSYERYLTSAAASPIILGYCRCQYVSAYRADRGLLKQGLFDEHGKPYEEVVSGFTDANQSALNLRQSMLTSVPNETKDAQSLKPVNLLVDSGGNTVTDAKQWPALRKQYLHQAMMFIYGRIPDKPNDVSFKTLQTRKILDGDATEKLFVMNIHRDGKTVPVRVGLIRPQTNKPCPVIIKNDRWLFDLSAMPPGKKRDQYAAQQREETFREVSRLAIDRGYAICKFVREDLAIDAPNSRETGVLAMYPEFDWGAIAAWAWGYQPLIDHLIDKQNFDAERIIATGHSRGGKTALAAAIFDQRIAIAAPSASGSCGTGSMQHFTPGGRRQTSEEIFKNHSYWFSPHLAELDSSKPLPVDGHTLRALVAPRGIINTQGVDDGLANPVGTKLMFDASEPVFELLGAANRTVTHWRPGGHGQTVEDWKAILDYADAFFAKEALPARFNNWPDQE